MNLRDIAILNMDGADYRYIITGISRSEAINLMLNINLCEKRGTLKNINNNYFIGCLYDNYKIKPLHIMLPKMRAYIKSYDGQFK